MKHSTSSALLGAAALLMLANGAPRADESAEAPMQPSAASEFWENVNYRRVEPALATTTSQGEIELRQLFMYTCPHCASLEPHVETWRRASRPSYVKLTRVPLTWDEPSRLHARMFYAAAALGRLEELHPLIYREIHLGKNRLDSPARIGAFFTAHGVSQQDFEKAFNAPEHLARIQRDAVEYKQRRIDSAPTFVINGRYLTDISMAGGPAQLLKLLNELIEAERRTP